ncbi:MAG: DUF1501 domain-containing protein [Rickettsiales bacterium]|nr:DUF1501 domain-containing protein [Rickettsiales bacterium]
MSDYSRRDFIQILGMGTLAAAMPLRFAYAAGAGDKRLLVVILRGAMDGLAAVPPIGDRAYGDARGAMALPQNGDTLINLDGYFAMHSALKPLADLYQKKELAILHATATPYRDRSHFDAQDLLENGSDKPHLLSTGWLNRAALALQGGSALALGSSIPLVLRGDAKVTSWAPSVLPDVDEDYLTRVMHMYQNDPLLLGAISEAKQMQGKAGGGGGRGPRAFVDMMKKAASFMSPASGPRIGAIDMGGWDTHANQGLGSGRLANNFKILAEGLAAYRADMGAAWQHTAVLVITEFGRTVKGNGTGGTDHGTASVAFLLGGSVNGGRVIGDWPGLARLHENRDLIPANDLRGVLKGTLAAQFGLSDNVLSSQIFPGSTHIAPIGILMKAG